MSEKSALSNEVYLWLKSFHLEEYYQIFIKNGYDNLRICALIGNDDLNIIGITLHGHRKMILKNVHELLGSSSPSSSQKTPIICKERKQLSQSHTTRADAEKQNKIPYSAENPIEFLLVRHGESQANVDKSIYSIEADHATQLSKLGEIQSKEAGIKIKEYFEKQYSCSRPADWNCRIWTSPYKRARQTAAILQANSGGWITDIRESIFLGEQQFGLFEGVDWANGEVDALFPNELQFYNKCSSFGGRFWASLPMGESRFDVCQRAYLTLSAMHRDGIKHVIIVSHGVTLRAWLMMYMNFTPEWFEESPNPVNCSIRLVKDGTDWGYIWPQNQAKETTDTDLLLKSKHVEQFEKCKSKIIKRRSYSEVERKTLLQSGLVTNVLSPPIVFSENGDDGDGDEPTPREYNIKQIHQMNLNSKKK